MNNQLIIDAMLALKAKISESNLYWKEPHQAYDEGEEGIYYEFFGNGRQGSEPARLLMDFNETHEIIECCVISQSEPFIHAPTTDHVAAYTEYLKLNGWSELIMLV